MKCHHLRTERAEVGIGLDAAGGVGETAVAISLSSKFRAIMSDYLAPISARLEHPVFRWTHLKTDKMRDSKSKSIV